MCVPAPSRSDRAAHISATALGCGVLAMRGYEYLSQLHPARLHKMNEGFQCANLAEAAPIILVLSRSMQ
jgi:hypothetical protein